MSTFLEERFCMFTTVMARICNLLKFHQLEVLWQEMFSHPKGISQPVAHFQDKVSIQPPIPLQRAAHEVKAATKPRSGSILQVFQAMWM